MLSKSARKELKATIKAAPPDAPVALSVAANYLGVGYQWVHTLMRQGLLERCHVPGDPAGAYVTAASLRARKATLKADGWSDKRAVAALERPWKS